MTFEEILPGLKAKKKICVQDGVGQRTTSSSLDTIEQNGVALEVTPYFLINVSGEGCSMWSPTPLMSSRQIAEVDDYICTGDGSWALGIGRAQP